ncbi:MAG: SDR family oxidoreductase [Acidimicrobiia bacterium]
MNVTILGGTGLLGKHLTPRLVARGHQVTITGRSVSSEPKTGIRGVRSDLGTGQGLAEAIERAENVVHLASDPARSNEVDVSGTERLLGLLGDRHLTYVSIVGVDRHPMPYYRSKLATERLIEDNDGLYTIFRATQFHDFVAYLMGQMTRGRVGLLRRGWVYQPIDVGEVAEELANLVETHPQGMAPDFAGPEILGIEYLARTYLTATGQRKPLVAVPRFGPVARAFRAGAHTNPDRAVGKVTWAEYLERRFADR